ncbi:response regulator transcription factor [Pseudarthrobacter sp. NamB4]|uniref:response regulator transcription factor n=1 Tax=Pseudarthrobacter sp. NamB4 TaxID=2576837 RepID=UPI0010FD042D|nr:response regulator transcription factor [Pseudarthrobacter sp. NamB4]TLM74510.1 response regulator transcription factor [Pseudarthrobacter sp. NamB4]
MKTPAAVVIEDDPDINLLISTILRKSGFMVHAAATGPAGVQAALTTKPSLITTDMDLPGFDSLELIRKVRTFSDAPIIVISANDNIRAIEMSLSAGADDFLVKPFRPRILQAHAEALLRRPVTPPD